MDEVDFSLPQMDASATATVTVTSTDADADAVKSLSLDPPPIIDPRPSVDWTFVYANNTSANEKPEYCLPGVVNLDPKLPRIVFYHIQHHAGTNFWSMAKRNKECAPRACHQVKKQCVVSYSEKVEADHIRKSPLTFIPYEFQLPRHFPMPFVNEREGFFFTTIMRNPIDRLKTVFRRQQRKAEMFWNTHPMPIKDSYNVDNLSVRWLAGVTNNLPITEQDMTLAKCRLESFDLVMTELTLDEGMAQVVCKQRNWPNCEEEVKLGKGKKKKNDPIAEMDPVVAGAWIERQRPSFELYDYARRLSAHQLKQKYGVTASGDPLLRTSFVASIEKYSNSTCTGPFDSCKKLGPHQPVSGCEKYHRIWANNQDLVPKIKGIGGILT
ncbi:MAG: hypothetical protein SGILL_002400 [Bacillariaceae sp.]